MVRINFGTHHHNEHDSCVFNFYQKLTFHTKSFVPTTQFSFHCDLVFEIFTVTNQFNHSKRKHSNQQRRTLWPSRQSFAKENLFFPSAEHNNQNPKIKQFNHKKKEEKAVGSKSLLIRNTLFCSVSVYYFPTEDDDDEDGPTLMEKASVLFFQGIDTFCVWECCAPWVKFKDWLSLIVFDPFVELFITLCIVVNTLFMALDHHDMDRDMEKILKRGNYVSIETWLGPWHHWGSDIGFLGVSWADMTHFRDIFRISRSSFRNETSFGSSAMIPWHYLLSEPFDSPYFPILTKNSNLFSVPSSVFHGNICHRSNDETLRNESKILFPSRLEYIRFYNCCIVVSRTGSGRCSRIVRVTIVPFGKWNSI